MRKCLICGKTIPNPAPYSIDICSSACFEEYFWTNTLDDTAIIIDGECYHDGGRVSRPNNNPFLGFAGREFRIKMNTGKEIVTNNLWRNGIVPKDRNVKDNAIFIMGR